MIYGHYGMLVAKWSILGGGCRTGGALLPYQMASRATKLRLLGGCLAAISAISASLGAAWLLYWWPGCCLAAILESRVDL